MDALLVIAYILLLLIVLICTKVKFGTIIKINFLFSLIWTVVAVISIINPYGLLNPSMYIHILILVSIIVFNIIYIMFSNHNNDVRSTKIMIDYKFIKILEVVALICILPNLISAVKIILEQGLDLTTIRDEIYLGLTNSGNDWLIFITKTVTTTIFTVISVISAYNLANNDKKLLKTAILNIIIGTLTFGGRNFILNYVLFYVSALILCKKKNNLKKRYVVVFVVILWIITALRTGDIFSFFETIIMYFSGSLSFLENILINPNNYALNEGLRYGYLTFSIITEPIVLVLKVLFKADIQIPNYYMNTYCQVFVNISQEGVRWYNNNTTMFYPFIVDFGKYFAWLPVLFIAILTILLERKMAKTNKVIYKYISMYLYTAIFTSTISYKINGLTTTLILILLYFICKGYIKETSDNERIYK